MRKLILIGACALSWSCLGQSTNSYDDSAACTTSFDDGLGFGGTIICGLAAFYMIRTIPGGDREE